MITYAQRYPGMTDEELNLIIHVLSMYAEGYNPRDDVGFGIISRQAKELAHRLSSQDVRNKIAKTHDEIDPTGFGAAFRRIGRRG